METTRWTGGLSGSQPSHHTRERGNLAIQKQRNCSPLSTKPSDSRSTRTWAKGHSPADVPLWGSGAAAHRTGSPRPPASPPQAARLGPTAAGRGTHLLILPACSCWRSRGGAVGGHCRSPGRQRPPRCRAPQLASRPPACKASGPDRWVSVARGAALPVLRIRSTVEI